MNISTQRIVTFCTFIFASHLFFVSAIGADYDQNSVLLIGRPERGGANIEKAKYPIINIQESTVWYLDPRSEGDYSIAEYFPCEIPSDKPQKFGTVILEQGMLNEVVITISHPTSSEVPLNLESERKSVGFTEADEELLKRLEAERKEQWQLWKNLTEQRDLLSKSIIEEALSLKLIEESPEHNEIYYRIAGEAKETTFSHHTVIYHLLDRRLKVRDEEEFRELERRIDAASKKMLQMDKVIDPLYKRKYASEERAQEAIPSQPAAEPFSPTVDPNDVYEHIRSVIGAAWDLVCPGGFLVVFAGDARIKETELAEGISNAFLSFTSGMIEEYPFSSQDFEGEHYFSNPVLPATSNIIGWTGGRQAGSYFLIQKP